MPYGDMIRIVGTIAVVCGHCCDMILFRTGAALSYNWWVCNIYDALTRWAVPAYIMLSGALLLDPARHESPREFYRKRLWRIGIPLVFFSAFFMWFSVYYTGWVKPRDAWINLLHGTPYMHMHFIFRIVGLYAFTPMLRIFLRHSTRTMQIGTVALLLCVFSADSVANGFSGTEYSGFIRFAPFMGYYLAGFLLRDPHLSWRGMLLCWIGFIATTAMLALGTGNLVRHYGMQGYPSMGMLLYDFLSPVRVIMAICAWLILTHVFSAPVWSKKTVAKPVHWLANATLGLYLIHPMFREMLYTLPRASLFGGHARTFMEHLGIGSVNAVDGFHGPWPSVWIGVPIITAMVYFPALLLTVIIMKIPYLRRITG
jgi:surface polysaccharide O-acyltransferase-like enzyme